MTRRARNNAVFSTALTGYLARHPISQSEMAKVSNVSRAYINKLANGATPSPEWCDLIAEITQATEEERRTLHRAAAISKGYRI